MVVGGSKTEDGKTRIIKGLCFLRCWGEAEKIRNVEALSLDPARPAVKMYAEGTMRSIPEFLRKVYRLIDSQAGVCCAANAERVI